MILPFKRTLIPASDPSLPKDEELAPILVASPPLKEVFNPLFFTFTYGEHFLITNIVVNESERGGISKSLFAGQEKTGIAATNIHQIPLSHPTIRAGNVVIISVLPAGLSPMYFSAALHGKLPAWKR